MQALVVVQGHVAEVPEAQHGGDRHDGDQSNGLATGEQPGDDLGAITGQRQTAPEGNVSQSLTSSGRHCRRRFRLEDGDAIDGAGAGAKDGRQPALELD